MPLSDHTIVTYEFKHTNSSIYYTIPTALCLVMKYYVKVSTLDLFLVKNFRFTYMCKKGTAMRAANVVFTLLLFPSINTKSSTQALHIIYLIKHYNKSEHTSTIRLISTI